jgi:hypothetical protein
MKTIFDIMEKNKATRLRIMLALYEFSGGKMNKWADLKEIAETKGIHFDEFKAAYDYLKEAGLIAPFASGYRSVITYEGVRAVENTLHDRRSETDHFPAYDDMGITNGIKEDL